MKLKLLDLFRSEKTLFELGENKEIKLFEAMQFGLELIKISPVLQEINKARSNLILKFGSKNIETERIELAPDTEAYYNFENELIQFLNNEQEIDLKRITISCKKDKSLGLSANQIIAVKYFIDFVIEE